MTKQTNGAPMPQIGLSTSAEFNEAVLKGAAMKGGNNSRIEVDYELYEAMLDEPGMSQADKRLLIDTLWNIVTSFVELGFGVHPVQQAIEAHEDRLDTNDCGQEAEIDSKIDADGVSSPIEEDAKGGPA